MTTKGTPEGSFLAWAALRPVVLQPLLPLLPDEVVSPAWRDLLHAIQRGEDTNGLPGPPATDTEGMAYIRGRLLAHHGAAVGRSLKSGGLEEARASWRLIDRLLTRLEAPPIENYAAIIPVQREVVPTGIVVLDQQIRGLTRQELGFIFMPPGRGKTLTLINFATGALILGYTVLYITVADQSKDELIPRIDTTLLGTPCAGDASEEILARRHLEARDRIAGTLWVADYTDRACTIEDIEQSIATRGVDLVIVDHADDVLSPISNDPAATRHSLRVVYMTLKQLAVRYDVPIWTASQSSEMSWHFKSTSIMDTSEAKVGKATGAGVILGFSAGPRDVAAPGIMYCTIAKARRVITERTLALRYDLKLGRLW